MNAASKRTRATVIVLMEKGVLLAGDQSGLVLLPGGGVDHGELPIAAAARELHEETGLVATSIQFLFHHESPTNMHHVYFCEAEGMPVAADDAEYLVLIDQPALESSLNLSPATRMILTRFEAWMLENAKNRLPGDAESVQVRRVSFSDPADCAILLKLMDVYASDPMGGGLPLPEEVKERLCQDLSNNPSAVSFIAWRDGAGKPEAIGLINCFLGYSTFKARPLLNIHDIVVLPEYRRQGIGQALLAAAEAEARERGCCKLTLEILSGNTRAMVSYKRFGFEPYTLDPKAGQASFMHKWLSGEG